VPAVPTIDIGPLLAPDDLRDRVQDVARAIDAACREVGFFTVVGHGVDPARRAHLDALARAFFARPDDEKATVAMARAGRAWRGWFPVGGELTSGRPDRKEGLYFGAELGADDPRVQAGVPLHGANLFPAPVDEWRAAVLPYLAELTRVGQAVLRGMAVGLGLDADWFVRHLTTDPLVLFRIFHYPPGPAGAPGSDDADEWGVGEHTDYGLLTLLGQDDAGGLQVRTPDGWIDVAPVPDSFVCNLGDMLDRLTGGRYRSTAHRVRNTSGRDRLSFPFFFDPSWDARLDDLPLLGGADLGQPPAPAPASASASASAERWDGRDLQGITGTYGDYILTKVRHVFPDLAAE
jgi:isopenicillin N synthase-like dioxygenase